MRNLEVSERWQKLSKTMKDGRENNGNNGRRLLNSCRVPSTTQSNDRRG